jgi:hypothetical protein
VVFVLLLVIAEVFLFQPGRFVAVVSLETLFVFLLYCCLTTAGRLFVLLLARLSLDLTLFSLGFLDFYWLFRFVDEFSALRADFLCLRLLHYANVVLCGIFECSYSSTGLLLLSAFWPDVSLDPLSAWGFSLSSGLAL